MKASDRNVIPCGRSDTLRDAVSYIMRAIIRTRRLFSNAHRWPFADPAHDGIVFDSVRNAGGTNDCLFRPKNLTLPITQGSHYQYRWDWQGKVSVSKL